MRRDTRTIQLRVTPHEGLVYERRAQAVGLSLSEWLRLLARRDCGLWTGGETMRIISSRTDARTYLYDTRADLCDLGDEYVDAVLDQIAHSDHPAWGEDWSVWLEEWLPGLIEETVRSVDALKG